MKIEEINVGSQSWASANLDTTYFQNGEKIPVVDNYSDWEKMASQGIPCCAYVKNKKTYSKYGLIYNGFCLEAPEEICPEGWKVPNINDLIELTSFLNFPNEREDEGYYNRGAALGMKGTKMWKRTFLGEPGDNSTSLNFLGGGTLTARNGLFKFDDFGLTATHWLADEHIADGSCTYFPPQPKNWPQKRKHTFSIGTGGDHSLSLNSNYSTRGYFIRLIKS